MTELDNLIEHYRNKTNTPIEQEQEILRQMDEEKKANPLSPENLDKNIVLLQEDGNMIGTVESMQMEMIDQLGTIVSMQAEKIAELEAKLNA